MPEGPEIRKAADKVASAILNQPVLHVAFGQSHLQHYESAFMNTLVSAVETHGKAMVTRFKSEKHSEGLNIYTHNQLYGRWVCCQPDQVPPTKRQLRLAIHTPDQWALLYSASDIAVLTNQELLEHPFLSKLGKDVLDPDMKAEYVAERLLSRCYRNRQLGNFLTEQSFLAGLGNYLRCEILFVAGVLPGRKPAELSAKQITRLSETILRLPRQSRQTQSITNDLGRVKQLLVEGSTLEDTRFWVFRRNSLPCYRCGSLIVKQQSAGQPCYLCISCQK